MSYFPDFYLNAIWSGIASIGWYLVAVAIAFWYAFPYLRERYSAWVIKKDEQDYAAKYHKNPDLSFMKERLSAVEASRQKMQEQYEKCIFVQKEEAEKKRKAKETQRLHMDNNSLGNVLGRRDDSEACSSSGNKEKSLKKEYNPLMGDGSRGYRPPKRSCCGKGGCG
ncbi:selenoprotein S-like [Ceratina calcarata]|uniref:Selenoprotein S-like n=1 Tax=Ceratina calcarata TaxID=156304 RepID=A0AAJ7J4C4_9HYME|nr:selenoprotein S-like [Ceratina calcarata]